MTVATEPDIPDLSIVVCAWNMTRELPRTLSTLAPGYQRGTGSLRWEVVVLDKCFIYYNDQ